MKRAAGLHVLVTAGPTREYFDDVRFLSNPSTGRMGFACARAACLAGWRVTLVTGPVEEPDPPGVHVVRVTTADEMRAAAMKAFRSANVVIATAAVSDWRPERREPGKVKKGRGRLTVALVPTPDILAEMGRAKGTRTLVGFALETDDEVRNALDKLRRKNLDAVVLNGVAAFGADRVDADILRDGAPPMRVRGVTKAALARRLLRLILFVRRDLGSEV